MNAPSSDWDLESKAALEALLTLVAIRPDLSVATELQPEGWPWTYVDGI